MKVLISGAGIAGPCLAWWLLKSGHEVTLVERASAPRTGGYVIDFWGLGYDIVERMGLLPRIDEVGYAIEEIRLVDAQGRRTAAIDGKTFSAFTGGRFTSLARGELSLALLKAVEDRVALRFSDSIESLSQSDDVVEVAFASAATETFDLVIGAEGIHSHTRELAFGPSESFECYLGYRFAAWIMPGYPHRTRNVYMAYGEPGRQSARFSLRDGSTLALLIWRDTQGGPVPDDKAAQCSLLEARFAGMGWEVPEMLATLEVGHELYLDKVSQVRMERWHNGRIALVGDAAFAPSFLAGQGAALAMIGAYVLAGELGRAGPDVDSGLTAYHARLARFMASKQDAARPVARAFVPETEFGIWFRAAVIRLMNFGPIARAAFGRTLTDQIDLPDYS